MLANYVTTTHAQLSELELLAPHPGLLFDLSGSYPKAVHEFAVNRRKRRAPSVDAALHSDLAAIAGDMRRALDKWASEHE